MCDAAILYYNTVVEADAQRKRHNRGIRSKATGSSCINSSIGGRVLRSSRFKAESVRDFPYICLISTPHINMYSGVYILLEYIFISFISFHQKTIHDADTTVHISRSFPPSIPRGGFIFGCNPTLPAWRAMQMRKVEEAGAWVGHWAGARVREVGFNNADCRTEWREKSTAYSDWSSSEIPRSSRPAYNEYIHCKGRISRRAHNAQYQKMEHSAVFVWALTLLFFSTATFLFSFQKSPHTHTHTLTRVRVRTPARHHTNVCITAPLDAQQHRYAFIIRIKQNGSLCPSPFQILQFFLPVHIYFLRQFHTRITM